MATTGAGNEGDGSTSPNPSVVEMLQNLNPTAEEGAVMVFADDEEEEAIAPTKWALVGKILSPSPVHIDSVRSAMRPAWGNPVGLKF